MSDGHEYVMHYPVPEKDADLIEEDDLEHQGHRSSSVKETGLAQW